MLYMKFFKRKIDLVWSQMSEDFKVILIDVDKAAIYFHFLQTFGVFHLSLSPPPPLMGVSMTPSRVGTNFCMCQEVSLKVTEVVGKRKTSPPPPSERLWEHMFSSLAKEKSDLSLINVYFSQSKFLKIYKKVFSVCFPVVLKGLFYRN